MHARAPLQTADRALRVLQQFRHGGETMTVGEIAAALELHRSTASRLVSTLAARGFLERAAGERIRLGPEAARLGRIASAGRELVAIAQPVMDRLALRAGEAATLAVPSGGGGVLTIAEAAGSHFVSSRNWIGVHTPPHCSADGKVLLAFGALAPAPGPLRRLTPRTIVERAALQAELEQARREGYAAARGELEEGLHGVAVPVRDGEACLAALCLSGPEYRMRGPFELRLAPLAMAAAAEIERRLRGERPWTA